MADLRAALGDDGAQPRFIRTVRGYGYAFCGTAVADATLADATPADPTPADPTLADPTPAAACRWLAVERLTKFPSPMAVT